ncbi:MAG TPA: hypothetical protein VLQ46_13230 [Casimicrobiaceae bacterium]|nr:hypothetical protein [Casimicrobiaceae bacterium]
MQEYLSMVASGNTMAADGAKLAFEANSQIDHKLLISVAPGGYLRRVQRAL